MVNGTDPELGASQGLYGKQLTTDISPSGPAVSPNLYQKASTLQLGSHFSAHR